MMAEKPEKLVKFCLQATYSNFDVDAIKTSSRLESEASLVDSSSVSASTQSRSESVEKINLCNSPDQLVERPWCFCFHTAFVVRRIIHHRR